MDAAEQSSGVTTKGTTVEPVAYFRDGSPHEYLGATENLAVNVGWLDRRHPFETGNTPVAFVSKLARLCEEPVGMTRGWRSCNLCDERAPQPGPTSVTVDGADVLVGSAEIGVPGADGVVFAAPNMILHYVADHRDLPPMEFVNAVTGSFGALP